ncbi:MAG TPA: uroporphyrinogen-III synthase [Acidimicrobiales bacterium]|nr:uroporphyrinogen-III synthase [Acidimicrobiales bacterium]
MSAGDAGRPLAGRVVAVTRSGPRARRLVDALERAGAGVLELPLTEQVDPADGGTALRAAAAVVGEFAWVVVTSVNTVERLLAALPDAGALESVRVAAVGPATAAALRRAGVEPDLVPPTHNARGLVAAFPTRDEGLPAGAANRVLFPCADLAPDTVPAGLGRKGWEVTRVEAYRTVPSDPPAGALVAQLAAADALVLTAASSVRAFQALRGADGTPVPSPGHVVCIGPITAGAARSAGMHDVHEAPEPSPEGIVAELVGHFGALGTGAS